MAKRLSTDYPPQMLAALEKAHLLGELIIPTRSAAALRLEFQRLRGALRAEGKPEQIDQLSFHVSPEALTIRVKAQSPLMRDLAAALGEPVGADDLFNKLTETPDATPSE